MAWIRNSFSAIGNSALEHSAKFKCKYNEQISYLMVDIAGQKELSKKEAGFKYDHAF